MDMATEAAFWRMLDQARMLAPWLVPVELRAAQPQMQGRPAPGVDQSALFCTRMKREEAEAFVPSPGGKAVLFDTDAPVIYLVSADNAGRTSTKILDYVERKTVDPMEEMRMQLSAMQQQMAQMAQLMAGVGRETPPQEAQDGA